MKTYIWTRSWKFRASNPFFMFQLTATVCLQTRANDSSIAEISLNEMT